MKSATDVIANVQRVRCLALIFVLLL